MQDKTKDKQPYSSSPVTSPKPSRSRIAAIEDLGRETRPARRFTDGKFQRGDVASREDKTLESATRISAEFIARESAEKAKLARETDLVRLDLLREREERLAAAIAANDKLEAVNRDLANVHDDAAAIRKSLSREHNIRVAAFIAAAVLFMAAVIYRSMSEFPGLSAPPVTLVSPSQTSISQPRSLAEAAASNSPGAAFADGLDSLNFMLGSGGGRTPEDAIRIVRATRNPAVCPFVWRNGQVSLTFNEDMDLSSLTKIFYDCADAVARLP